MSRWPQQVLRWLLPWACAGCRIPLETVEDSGFCGVCWLRLPRLERWVCERCGVPLREGALLCYPCHQNPSKILIRAATAYQAGIQNAIHRFKYAGRQSLAPVFSVLLAYAWDLYPALAPIDTLISVPLHSKTLRYRGYNQAHALAQELAFRLRRPVLADVLYRTRLTQPQFKLNREERTNNLQGAFAARLGYLKHKNILLIDDVCTTGSTLMECAHALKKAGARSVKALVLARD